MPTENVLVQINSAANLGGFQALEQALSGANLGALATGVALGAVAEGVKQSIDAYVKLGSEVEDFQRVAGGSAEQASRMVETFNILGVSTDVAAAALFRLSRNLATGESAKKLAEFGVVAQTNAQGNVDLAKTLGELADRYDALSDPAQKNLLIFDAFGRSGAAMIPVLEKGSAALKAYEESAGLVFSQEDLDRLKQYKIDQAELNQNWEEFKANIGRGVLPAIEAVVRATNRQTEASNLASDSLSEQQIQTAALSGHAGLLQKNLEAQADANYAAKQAMDEATASIKAQQDAADALNKSVKDANTAIDDLAGNQFKLDDANNAVFLSQDKVNAAWDKYKQDVKDRAPLTQLRQDEVDINVALDDQKKAYLDLAGAKVQEDVLKQRLAGSDMTATDAIKDQIKYLQEEANSLAPGSPLRQYLQQYIDMLKSQVPSDVYTNLHARQVGAGGSTNTRGGTKAIAAAGGYEGDVSSPTLFMAGEGGSPEHVSIGPAGSAGGSGYHVHVHVDQGAYIDGPSIDRLANLILRRARYAPGT